MPLFICENCHCVENTALGQFWSSDSGVYPDPFHGKNLCSECGSPKYVDGRPTKFGKWHGKFPKETFDPEKHDRKDFMELI